MIDEHLTAAFDLGYAEAAIGVRIANNPYPAGSPAFNYYVDGWCNYWATAPASPQNPA